MDPLVIDAKLQALLRVLRQRTANWKSQYFDFAVADEWFGRYELLRDALRGQYGDFLSDLPVRDRPKSSGTSDFDGHGYVTRAEVRLLMEDIEYCLAVLPLVFESISGSAKVTREGVFFAGQQFDALERVREIFSHAEATLDLIDGYIGENVLSLLTAKSEAVVVRILTRATAPALKIAAEAFNKQYGGLAIRESDAFHDRFMLLDGKVLYHFGASIKDLGQRGFMFSLIEEDGIIEAFISKFEETWREAPESVAPKPPKEPA